MSVNPHDRVRVFATVGGHTAECRCGRTWTRPTEDQARAAHDHHHGVETAREALKRGHYLELVKDTD